MQTDLCLYMHIGDRLQYLYVNDFLLQRLSISLLAFSILMSSYLSHPPRALSFLQYANTITL